MNKIATKQPQENTLRSQIESEGFAAQIAKVLPSHLTPERMVRVAVTAMLKTPKLMQCTQTSFFNCMLTCSQFGIEPDGRLAHLIPFENRKAGTTDCQLIIDYKGLVALALRSGSVSSIHADKVCTEDIFVYDKGQIVTHKIDFRSPRGKPFAYYAIVKMKDGSEKCDVMQLEEVEAIRRRSRSASSGPWVTDFDEMAKKGLALDTLIPTPEGWTTMERLMVGDIVFDMHGVPTSVLAVSEVKHIECFRVTLANGESIVCDDEHRWCASVGSNGSRSRKMEWPVLTINEMMQAKDRGESVCVPVSGPLSLPEIELPVDPWILGYWLGNGNRADGNVTCHRDDSLFLQNRIAVNCKVGAVRDDARSNATSIGIKSLKVALRQLGVLNNKHVPSEYLRGSVDQRLMLLQGLMDSDGHIDKERGRAHFYSTDQCLSDAVAELASSLGNKVFQSCKEMSGYGKIVKAYYVGWQPTQACVTTPRKLANYRERKISPYCSVKSIEKVDSVATKCIAVCSPTHTYLCGRGMIPTHNTAFRRLSKWIELSPEFRSALDHDDKDFIEGTVSNRSVRQSDAVVAMLDNFVEVASDDEPVEPEVVAGLDDKKSVAAYKATISKATTLDALSKVAAAIALDGTLNSDSAKLLNAEIESFLGVLMEESKK